MYVLHKNQKNFHYYELKFEKFTSQIGKTSQPLSATILNPEIVAFNSENKTFKGLSTGVTKVVMNYGELKKEIYFEVDSVDVNVVSVFDLQEKTLPTEYGLLLSQSFQSLYYYKILYPSGTKS